MTLADLVRTPDETLVSDPRSLLPLLTVLSDVTFEGDESDESCRCDSGDGVSGSTSGNGEEGRGVISDMVSGIVGRLAAIFGDRGSMSVFSLMLMIIFSSPKDVMCFSLPLLRLSAESSASSGTCFEFRGNGVALAVCIFSVSSDAAESTLEDSEGISFGLGCRGRTWIAGVVARCGCASQQNVSLFHSLQLRFSNLFPSSMDSAHLEKTGSSSQNACLSARRKRHVPIHIPKRLSTFLGSTLCILPASTVRTGAAKREGIAAVLLLSPLQCRRCESLSEQWLLDCRRLVGE
jgi:hypothetical protein